MHTNVVWFSSETTVQREGEREALSQKPELSHQVLIRSAGTPARACAQHPGRLRYQQLGGSSRHTHLRLVQTA